MKPEELRKVLAAKEHPSDSFPNAIDILGDEKSRSCMMRFRRPADNLVFTAEQLRAHIDALLQCARAVGIKYSGAITWDK